MNRSKSLIAVGIILCLLLSFLTPFILPGNARAQPADSPWPTFGQNQQRTGQSPYTGPEVPYPSWRFTTGNWVYSSPAIGTDGTIYVGSRDKNLYAVNPDGSEKWRFTTGGWVDSPPTIGADGTIYVGSLDKNLYAVNPDGSERWRFTTGGSVHSSPAIGADGTIHVNSGDGDRTLYAINPDGSEKWRVSTGYYVYSSPAIGTDGTIYIGSGSSLYALNPDSSEKWRFATRDSVLSSPAIGVDGTIYVGSCDSYLYAINPDGSEKWRFSTGYIIYSSPALGADGTIYVGSGDKNLYALNPDGSEKWRFATRDSVFSSPAIGVDGTIYVGTHDNNLYAVNPDGNQKWRFTTGAPLFSSPAIGADSTIYVGSYDHKLYAISEAPEDYVMVSPVTPSAGAINVDRTKISFTWNAQGEIDSFGWVLSANPDLSDPIESTGGVAYTSCTSTVTLDHETTYYWQVTAWRNGDMVSWSDIASFTTMPEPPPPPEVGASPVVGVKAGDYIKMNYEITGWPADQPRPEWLKLEFLTVEDTSVTVLATMRMSDGTEETDTVPVEVGGGAEASGLSGFIIPANSQVGYSVFMGGFDITFADTLIEGETTGAYAGASRTAVCTSFAQHGVDLTYCWDKQTGVLVESTAVYADMTMTATVTETNLWEGGPTPVPNGGPTPVPWWPWAIVAVAVVAAATALYYKKRKVGPGASPQ